MHPQLCFSPFSISIGFTIATSAIVSRAIGSGNLTNVKYDAGCLLIFTVSINIIIALILYPLLGPILYLLGAAGETYEVALDFLQIVNFAIPLMGFGMCCTGLLRAKADGRRAMYVTLSAGIAAAILDPLLILYLDMGVRGAAIATALTRVSLVFSGLYGVVIVHRMIALPSLQHLVRLSRPFLIIAIPAVLTQIATPFSNAYMFSIMSEFGDGAVTGWTIIGRLVPLVFVAMFTLSAAVGPILGQNLGAKFYKRIYSTIWDSLLFLFIYALVMWALLVIFADNIIMAFGASGEAEELVRFFILIIGGTYVFQGGLFVANAAFNNLGYPLYSTFFNWGRATIGTIPFALLGAYWGPNWALAGFSAGGVLFGIAAVVVCLYVVKNLTENDAVTNNT